MIFRGLEKKSNETEDWCRREINKKMVGKMKVFQINTFGNLSTGRIAVDLYKVLKDNGHDGMVAYARNTISGEVPHYVIGSMQNVYVDALLTRMTGRAGFFSKSATIKLIEKIKFYDPDVIHLHNLHGYYINVEVLFDYLQISKKPVVWTLHDCWAFTGHCCSFSAIKCDKWKTQCYNCPQKHSYPASYIDYSESNYLRKKSLFIGVRNMHIVTVSKWLENVTKQSYLKSYPIETIYNGIDTSVFKPTKSNVKERLNIENRKVILGVASTWSTNKGLKDFIVLSKLITNDYVIVLVGLSKQQIKDLPSNMIGLPRTNSVNELVELYSAASVLFNASIEETFGMTTVEAMACGTPVIVYNSTAVPEVVSKDSGKIVEANNVEDAWAAIREIDKREFCSDLIVGNAKKYEKGERYHKYLELYEKIIKKKYCK